MNKFIGIILIVAVIIPISVGMVLYTYVDQYSKIGPMGDFFGGFSNPLLTFMTFIGVLTTIYLQREELSETRKELSRSASALETQISAISKQNFETSLFQMLHLHNQTVSSLEKRDDHGGLTSGRAVFGALVKKLRINHHSPAPHYEKDENLPLYCIMTFISTIGTFLAITPG